MRGDAGLIGLIFDKVWALLLSAVTLSGAKKEACGGREVAKRQFKSVAAELER